MKKRRFTLAGLKQLAEYMILYYLMGKPIEYEVLVDGISAIRRTNDLLMFYTINVTPFNDFKEMEIVLYREKSKRKDRLIFTFD